MTDTSPPASADALAQALDHHQAGRLDEAERFYRRVLEAEPRHIDANHNLGVLAIQRGRPADGLAYLKAALDADPTEGQSWLSYVDALLRAGRLSRARSVLNEVLSRGLSGAPVDAFVATASQPGPGDKLFQRALVHQQAGRTAEAAADYRATLDIDPDHVVARNNFGVALRALGQLQEAEAQYRLAIETQPDLAMAYNNLGDVLRDLGRLDEAVYTLHRSLELNPNEAGPHCTLGAAFAELGRLDEAAVSFRRAIEINPDYAEALSNLANILRDVGRLDEAERLYREALRLRPDFLAAHSNLGVALLNRGRADEAVACYREALRLDPDFAIARSNLIFALDMVAGATPAEQQRERRNWYERHARRFAPTQPDHANTRDPDRALRIGYVSADLRRSSAWSGFGGILRRHDRSRFKIYCYSNSPPHRDDDVTQKLRAATDEWRLIFGVGDDAVAERIRSDRIDILVDLSGHMAGQRLLVFARKPAPIQVTAWGSATGTGVETIDYMFGDPIAVPHGVRMLFAETIVDLPCLSPYEPWSELPAPVERPSRADGVTFGCFNRLAKITQVTLDLMGRVLAANPNARLLFKGGNFETPVIQAEMRSALAAHGVATERLSFAGSTPYAQHLAAYGDVDIALDPIPHGGGISTCDALAMGVPVVALKGKTVVGRASASYLTALGMTDWIADDADRYVAIATRQAADLANLRRLRTTLRDRLTASPVGDLDNYARAVEDSYRTMWRRWCARPAASAR